MNPVIFNCFLIYVLVILLSLLQSRFQILKDDPITYCVLLIILPFIVFGKAVSKGLNTWPEITGLEIFVYTLMLAFSGGKRMVPRINEGYIYAYTLFHWYLLYDAIQRHGYGFWNVTILLVSVYPTYLILRAAFQHKKLPQREKVVQYYWFLFIVTYSFISQIAQSIIKPILTAYEISFTSFGLVLFSAIQLYFISTIFCLLLLGLPLFHMDRSAKSFAAGWKAGVRDWKQLLRCKLDSYIEYQINYIQVVYITAGSAMLFYIDASYKEASAYLIVVYTIFLPLVYFYFKAVPHENLEDPFYIPEESNTSKVSAE